MKEIIEQLSDFSERSLGNIFKKLTLFHRELLIYHKLSAFEF